MDSLTKTTDETFSDGNLKANDKFSKLVLDLDNVTEYEEVIQNNMLVGECKEKEKENSLKEEFESDNFLPENQSSTKKRDLTREEKFKLMYDQCQILCLLCADVPMEIFYQRLEVIKNLLKKLSSEANEDNEAYNSEDIVYDSEDESYESGDSDISDIADKDNIFSN